MGHMKKIKSLLLAFLLLQVACNFVHFQERMIQRSMRRSGLVKQDISLDSDQIAYWEGGTGPTLVLLHGFGADGTFGWSEQVPVLSKHFHLIIPDLLWFGGSQSSQLDFSVEHQASAVKKLVSHLGVGHFDVAGISYGGLVALMLMSELPEQINRGIIVSSPGPVYTRSDYEKLLDRFQVQSAAEIVLPTSSKGLERLLKIAYKNPPYVPFFAKQDVIDFVQDWPDGKRTALLKHVVEDLERLKNQLKKVHDRVLIIWGSEDTLFPVELGVRLKNYFGDEAVLKVLQGAKHAPNIEFSSEFNQAVLDFLQH